MMNTRLDFTIAGEDLIRRDTAAGQSLRMAIDDNNTGGEPQDYSRYWHGYLVYLKPLLTFLTVPAIRLLNFVIQFILLFMVILKINDVLNKKRFCIFDNNFSNRPCSGGVVFSILWAL